MLPLSFREPDSGLHCLEFVECLESKHCLLSSLGFCFSIISLQCSGCFFGVCVCWPVSLPSLHKAPVQCVSGLWTLLVVADMLFIF